jgi:hypothetical protein
VDPDDGDLPEMPDLDEGKFYTADDMRKARADGERRGAENPELVKSLHSTERGPRQYTGMIGSEVSRAWDDPAFRREIITVATKAAQIAVRGRDEAAAQLGLHDPDLKSLIVGEEKCRAIILEIVKHELAGTMSSIGLEVSDDAARIRTAMQLRRTFDLEENSTKLLKRIAWQAFVGFVSFCVIAAAAWFGFRK